MKFKNPAFKCIVRTIISNHCIDFRSKIELPSFSSVVGFIWKHFEKNFEKCFNQSTCLPSDRNSASFKVRCKSFGAKVSFTTSKQVFFFFFYWGKTYNFFDTLRKKKKRPFREYTKRTTRDWSYVFLWRLLKYYIFLWHFAATPPNNLCHRRNG